MELLIATGNAGKLREFRQMLGADRFDLHDLSRFPEAGDVEETGRTFRANACLKAATYATRCGAWTLADDSGLEVDCLAGAPGVLSARWAQSHNAGVGDAANNALLLRQLQRFSPSLRTARFVCVLALADPGGQIILTARESMEGSILPEPRGNNGFGYDPLFVPRGLDLTTAELEPEQKHRISHRGKALRAFCQLLDRAGVPGQCAEPAMNCLPMQTRPMV